MYPQNQKTKAVAIAHRLLVTLHDASQVTVAALKLKDGAAHDVLCSLAIAEPLAYQVTQTALAGLAAIGLSPAVPNGLEDDEIAAAFLRSACLAASKMGLDDPLRGSLPTEQAAERAGAALLTQAEELAGLARQAMFRAAFYVSRAQAQREAK